MPKASTSTKVVKKVLSSAESIHEIKEKLRKQNGVLRKMKKGNSVDFITNPNTDFSKILEFYSKPEDLTLYISPDAERVMNIIINVMNDVKVSEKLSGLTNQMTETRKVFECIVKRVTAKSDDNEHCTNELERITERASTNGNEFAHCSKLKLATLRNLFCKGFAQLTALDQCKAKQLADDDVDPEQIEKIYKEKQEKLENVCEDLELTFNHLQEVRENVLAHMKVKRSSKEPANSTATQFLVALEAFKKDLRRLPIKTKTNDPIAKNMLFSFEEYQADVNLLLSHYIETATIYKYGTSDLINLCAKLTKISEDKLERLTTLSVLLTKIDASNEFLTVIQGKINDNTNFLKQNDDFINQFLTSLDLEETLRNMSLNASNS